MFTDVAWAWTAPVENSSQRLVLLDLADRANADHQCWPSQTTIAERTRLSERTVRGVLKDRHTARLLQRLPRFDSEGHRTSDQITLAFVAAETRQTVNARLIENQPPVLPVDGEGASEVTLGVLASLLDFDWEPMPEPQICISADRRQHADGAAGANCRQSSLDHPTNKGKEQSARQQAPAVERQKTDGEQALRDALMTILAGRVSSALGQKNLPLSLRRCAPERVREVANRLPDRLQRAGVKGRNTILELFVSRRGKEPA